MAHTGGCLCAGVTYAIDAEIAPFTLCHCSMCRKASGTAFAANVSVPGDAFKLTGGEQLLKHYQSSSGKKRFFCGRCGSPLFVRYDSHPDSVRVRVGTLDTPIGARPRSHIFATSKAGWFEIHDALPQHEAREPER